MKYPVHIEKTPINEFVLKIIDLPGCETTGLSVDECLQNLEKIAESHLTILCEYGEKIPSAKTIDYHMNTLNTGIWAILDIDIVPYLGKSQKINVTLPELLIKQIDDRVSKSSEHKTRSGFIASVCLKELAKG